MCAIGAKWGGSHCRPWLAAWVLGLGLAVGCGDVYHAADPPDGATPPDSGFADANTGPDSGVCGDDAVNGTEACDGNDLNGLGCEQLGFVGGVLSCSPDCTPDTSGCISRCGNGAIDPGEQCDGNDLAGLTCQSLGLEGGVLSCDDHCRLALTGCPGCGNGVREAGEACDGTDFGPASCAGGLACTAACRIDATACGVPGTGSGSDGALYVQSAETLPASLSVPYSVATLSADRATVDASADHLSPGDELLLINLQGSAAECATAGEHEFLTVASVNGSEVVFTTPVSRVYGVGGSNADLSGQAVVLQRVPHLTSLTVTATGTLTVGAWDGTRGGVLALRVAGPVTVDAGGRIALEGLGFRGGIGHVGAFSRYGRQGESLCGNPQSETVTPNDGGGGGGLYADTDDDCGQGGGGAGYGAQGTWKPFTQVCQNEGATTSADNGGLVYGEAALGRWYLGSGGGAGASDDNSDTSGTGGRGGGILILFAQSLHVDGTVDVHGADGEVPFDYEDSGNGGGGSGGTVQLQVGTLSGSGHISAAGGIGPASVSLAWNSPGGDGAYGRVRVDYQSAYGQLQGAPLADWYLEQLCYPAPGHTSLLF